MDKNSVCVNNHFLYDILCIMTRQCTILQYGQFLSAINAYYYYYYYYYYLFRRFGEEGHFVMCYGEMSSFFVLEQIFCSFRQFSLLTLPICFISGPLFAILSVRSINSHYEK